MSTAPLILARSMKLAGCRLMPSHDNGRYNAVISAASVDDWRVWSNSLHQIEQPGVDFQPRGAAEHLDLQDQSVPSSAVFDDALQPSERS
jgi:hypothetical protein